MLKICTFSPKTNSKELVFNENSKSVYKRLFDDYSRRKYNSQLNQKKIDSEFDREANKKHLKNLDKKRIEKLYLDHKKFKNNKGIMQKNFDDLDGLTFKPSIPNADKYEITNDFYQRNEILLHKKNIFSDWYQKILKENFDKKQKNYTPDQIEEIKKNIVDRLYKRDLEKIIEKNNLHKDLEKERYNYKSDLRNNENMYYIQNNPNDSKVNKSSKSINKKNITNEFNSFKNSTGNIIRINTNNNIFNNSGHISHINNSMNNYNNNNIGERFSFKDENIINNSDKININNPNRSVSNYEGDSQINNNFSTFKNFNDLPKQNSNFIDSNSNTNIVSKFEDNNDNESVITEIENNNEDNYSQRKLSLNNINKDFSLNRKNLSNEELSTDKNFKTIDNTSSTIRNKNARNSQQNGKQKDSEVLLKHFLNNNYNNKINNKNPIENNNFERAGNYKSNDQNSNLALNYMSIASPHNILSTKATNNYRGSDIKNISASYSNMDQFNGEFKRDEYDTINQDYENNLND